MILMEIKFGGGAGLVSAIAIVLWMFWIEPKITCRIVENKFIKFLVSKGNLTHTHKAEIEIREEGILDSDRIEEVYTWNEVEGAYQDDDFGFVFLTKKKYILIPKKRIIDGNLDTFIPEVARRAAC